MTDLIHEWRGYFDGPIHWPPDALIPGDEATVIGFADADAARAYGEAHIAPEAHWGVAEKRGCLHLANRAGLYLAVRERWRGDTAPGRAPA